LQLSSTRRHLSTLALGRPVAFGIALTIIWWAVLLLFAFGLPRLSPSWFPDIRSTLVNLGAFLVPLAVVAAFGWWRQAGLALPRPDRSWWSLLPLLAFALSFAAGGISGSPAQYFSSAVLFLVLGLNEELLYRGVIQHATNTLGAVRSVVWVALLFGFQHAGTGFFYGHSLYDTVAMVISATSSGAAYAAVMHILEHVSVTPEGHRGIAVALSPICPDSPPRWAKSRSQITRRSAKTLYLWAWAVP
jgi:membrane protease YdiL (CAAX protease family)